MALDLQDQEELENAKRAWKLWGRWVFLAAFVAALIYVGNMMWTGYVHKQNAQAMDIYDRDFLTKAEAQDEAGVLQTVQTLQRDYPKSAATAMATLQIADASFMKNKLDDATNHLKWLLNTQKNEAIQALVRQRLATVYLQQEKYDDALSALNASFPQEFAGRINELKGDIYMAQNKKDEAHKAYDEALKTLPAEDKASRDMIEAKILL